jgi:DNA (cytosine-5)-methyltransferase 1
MKLLSLFSGIGGIDLAAQWAGFETVCFVEKDAFCQKVLSKHWPDTPIHDDVTKFDGTKYSGITLLAGGFPCQPFSTAGKRQGDKDDRHLWPEMFRVIKEARPAWVLGENVAGLVRLALDDLLSDLESEGYSTQAFVIPACAANALHRRDRVWIVAYSECVAGDKRRESSMQRRRTGETKQVGLGGFIDADSDSQRQSQSEGREQDQRRRVGDICEVASNATHARSEGGYAELAASARYGQTDKPLPCGKNDSDATSERLPNWAGGTLGQPFPLTEFERSGGREIERNFRGMAYGVSRRVDRLRALGNAVVPQQVYPILKAIADFELARGR